MRNLLLAAGGAALLGLAAWKRRESAREVDELLRDAYVRGASEVVIEPRDGRVRVSFWIDGSLVPVASPSKEEGEALIAELLRRAGLDPLERGRPREGRIRIAKPEHDVWLTDWPVASGRKCSLRLLATSSIVLGLDAMGFTDENLATFRAALLGTGLVLVTGPRGSGKRATLHAAFGEVEAAGKVVLSIDEDEHAPVERFHRLAAAPGFPVAEALRAARSLEPDAILVADLRDREVAELALELALEGRLVLASLATGDAVATIERLLWLADPFLVRTALGLVCSQQLGRRLCRTCKVPVESVPPELVAGSSPATPFEARGCERCAGTGFKGRVGFHEVLALDDELRALIRPDFDATAFRTTARRRGLRSFREDVAAKVRAGVASLESAASYPWRR